MGYVGLTTSVALAWIGHTVRGIEAEPGRLSALRAGCAPFFEPGLTEAMAAVRPRLTFGADLGAALAGAGTVLLTVGTPAAEGGTVDLRQLWAAGEAIAAARPVPDLLVVNKATAPPGTLEALGARLPGLRLACNPEFLQQGRALRDALYPERIVVGTDAPSAAAQLQALYGPLLTGAFSPPPGLPAHAPGHGASYVVTAPRAAELAKYAANAFLAAKISFANEIANLCELLGADAEGVLGIVGGDPRIGPAFLQPGIGWGGGCLPKDTGALAQLAAQSGYEFHLLRAAIAVNRTQWRRVVDRLATGLGGLAGRRIAVLGLAFKPGTDDLRGAPSLVVIPHLISLGAEVTAHDRLAAVPAAALLPAAALVTDRLSVALEGADALLVLTDWPEYRALGPDQLRGMRGNLIVDGRNALDPTRLPGWRYVGVGRPAAPGVGVGGALVAVS